MLGESRAGLAVTNDYNAFGQRTVTALASEASTLTSFGYDGLGRIETVTRGQEQFSYGYLDNTRLVASMTARHGGNEKMTVTRKYDRSNRLVAVNTTPSGGPPLTFGYSYNMANQRIRSALADGSSWAYGYDGLGQVKSGKRRWSDGAPVPGQQFEYAFDQIGNRTSTQVGGDDRGAALREASYTANRLNQYDERQVPGGLDVVGIARVDAVVEVEGTTNGMYRHAEYFDRALSLDNTNDPLWTTVEVESTWNSQTDTRSGQVWLPQTPESFDYDQDGNLTQDGRWTLTWDGENRLTRLVARTATGPQQRIDFAYDWRGRRISKKVWTNTEGTGTPAVDLHFVYDGWNLLAILDPRSQLSPGQVAN